MPVPTIWTPFPQNRVYVPEPIEGMVAWFDVNDTSTITKDGGNLVSSLEDKSGYGNNATAAGANRPLWVDAAINGLPVIRFNGSSNIMSAGNAASLLATELTLFMVMKEGSNTSWTCMIKRAAPESWNNGWGIAAELGASYNCYINTGYSVALARAAIASYSVVTFRYDKSLGSDNLNVFVDGASQDTDDYTADIDTTVYNLTIGGDDTGAGNYFWAGDFAEILVYGTGLSAADTAHNEAYLSAKWGT